MKTLLRNRGFQSFLWTQFLGALNDNLYKMIVSLRAVYVAAQTGQGGEYLSIALGVFSIPFLLFSGYSGHFADRLSKRTVLIAVKIFEIGVMSLGVLVFFSSDVRLMLIVLFLMALHSTIFSPAKYGIVPEIAGDKDLSRANALLEMTTFVAIILGTALGGLMFKLWKEEPWKMGVVMVAIAIAGFGTSLGITRVAASGAKDAFQWNPFAEVITGTKHLLKDRPLWLTVIGISYFFFLGALFQTDLVVFGSDVLKVDETHIALMVGCLAVGIGIGSMLAGRLSGDKVEIGLVPLGSALMTMASAALYASKGSYVMSVLSLVVMGIASGLFIVPLNAYLQQRSGAHVVCIFAEGAISRTGNLLPFKRGMEKIVDGLAVPVVPVHLDRLWGSIFSFEGGRFFWKWPKRIPYPVTVSFGNPMPSEAANAHDVRQAIAELASEAVAHRKTKHDLLHLRFVKTARKNWSSFAMADTTGRELTYGRALTGAMLIAGWAAPLRQEMIGVLLPSSVGGSLANLGITMAGKVPVNLNFTAGTEAMRSAVGQCGMKTILTSRVFLAKAKLDAMEGMVFLEDVIKAQTKWIQLRALMKARFAPPSMLRAGRTPDSLAAVIFSSGSTGTPKGVMLSHYNILSNIEAIGQVFWLGERDRIVGVLPFFHSFGFTVTIWLPMISGCGAAYHANPTDGKAIGELVARYKGTFLLSTPTFCSGYSRKVTREQFATLRFVLVGAEKLRESIAKQFEEAFGVELLEGYGCTEMSPVVAVNVPNFEAGRDTQVGNKFGTVGHPLPGVAARIVDPETMEPRGANQEGLLLVKGANRMLGYVGRAAAGEDGWYRTGDIAVLDDEGFLRITDRLSRFSKIAGEMVPHLRIEDALHKVCGDDPCVVVGIPDEKKGERLVALYTTQNIEPEDLWKALADSDMPRLWVPKRENIYRVEGLPTLGTGKLDLRGVKAKAGELARVFDAQSA